MRGHFDYELFQFPPFGRHFIDRIGFGHGRFGPFHGPLGHPDKHYPFGGHGNIDHHGFGHHGHRRPQGLRKSDCCGHENGNDSGPEYHHRSSNPEDSDHVPDHRRGPHHPPRSPRCRRRFDHSPDHGFGRGYHCKRFGPRRCCESDCHGGRDKHGCGPWMRGRQRRPHPYNRTEDLDANDCEECQHCCCSKNKERSGKRTTESIPSHTKDKDDNAAGDTILVQRIMVEKAARPRSV